MQIINFFFFLVVKMFRSALYEYTHDYAILGEESGEEAIINYVEN